MAHPNEDLLRTGYAAFMEQDISTVFGIIDPAIVWRSGDHNALTGTFHGHDEVAAFFIKLLEVTGGTIKLTLQRIIADDSGAAVMVDATGERDGQFYAWQQAHVWEMRDGKATSLTLYSNDGRTVDRVFA